MEFRRFNSEDLNIIREIIGSSISDIFYQPVKDLISSDNMFVINFGEKCIYSLHVFCFLRIRDENEIILTSSDEYFSNDFMQLNSKVYDSRDEFEKSLLFITIKTVKSRLKGSIIRSVTINNIGDIIIQFDNGIQMEIIPDCMFQDYEYYRFFNTKKFSPHYIVGFLNGLIVFGQQDEHGKTDPRQGSV